MKNSTHRYGLHIHMILEFGPQFEIISCHVWDKRVFELEEHSFMCNIPIMLSFHNRIAGMRKLTYYYSTSGELNLLFKDGCCRADRMYNARETIISHHPHPRKWPIWDIFLGWWIPLKTLCDTCDRKLFCRWRSECEGHSVNALFHMNVKYMWKTVQREKVPLLRLIIQFSIEISIMGWIIKVTRMHGSLNSWGKNMKLCIDVTDCSPKQWDIHGNGIRTWCTGYIGRFYASHVWQVSCWEPQRC